MLFNERNGNKNKQNISNKKVLKHLCVCVCECDDTAFCGVSVSYKHHGYVDVCVFLNMNARM